MFELRATDAEKLIYILVTILSIFGLLLLYFAYISNPISSFDDVFQPFGTQAVFIVLGFVVMFLVSSVKYKKYEKLSPYIFGASVLAMCLLFFIGVEVNGATRWIDLNFINFQPSEFFKIGICVFLAYVLSRNWGNMVKMLFVGFTTLILFISSALQPDFGTLILMLAVIFFLIFAAGLSFRKTVAILVFGIVLIASISVASFYVDNNYVFNRVKVYWKVNLGQLSSLEYRGDAYHSIANLRAFGEGGIIGKGTGSSVISITDVPERTTDSIFTVAGEEYGFLGTVFYLFTFLFLFYLFFKVANATKDAYGKYLALSLASLLSVQTFLNIAVTLSLFPATGIPLILTSKGGSSIVFTFLTIGIILSVLKSNKGKI